MAKPRTTYKLKRLRDGSVTEYDATHALDLLRLNAKQSKSEFELAEKNYTFKDNEIQRNPSSRNNQSPEE